MSYKIVKLIVVVAISVVVIVWGFFVFRLYSGYGSAGYVSSLSKLPILSEDFEGLRVTGRVKYAFRRQARGQACFIVGQAELESVQRFWEEKKGWEICSLEQIIRESPIIEGTIELRKTEIIDRWIKRVNADPCDFPVMIDDDSIMYAKKSSPGSILSSEIEMLYSPKQKRFAAIASRSSSD